MKTNKGLPYCISFDTNEMPGKIIAVRVELSKHIMTVGDSVNIALFEHPLYEHLEEYVLNNVKRRNAE